MDTNYGDGVCRNNTNFLLMKKLILLIALTSCSVHNKTTKDLETLKRWIHEDYKAGEIPHANANNYYIILESIIYELNKKQNDK